MVLSYHVTPVRALSIGLKRITVNSASSAFTSGIHQRTHTDKDTGDANEEQPTGKTEEAAT
jgi:hypothetical protein